LTNAFRASATTNIHTINRGMIDVSNPFAATIYGYVIYDGRAFSTLEHGDYLVIRKADGSFQIHGASAVKPLNYQRPKSRIATHPMNPNNPDSGFVIECRNGSETISVYVEKLISFMDLQLSDNKPLIERTEKHLTEQIFKDIHRWVTGCTDNNNRSQKEKDQPSRCVPTSEIRRSL
jgi:hypothetical protein